MLTILYRGSLSSCNYSCGYCPFAKRRDSRSTLARDATELARFVDWVGSQTRTIRILFTPWGEALVRHHYRHAMLALAAMPHVSQVAVQTNLAGPLSWLADAPGGKVSLWCTYHPDQTRLERFVDRIRQLAVLGIRHSVGIVARHEHNEAIRALKSALPATTPFWLNAYDRRGPGYYTAVDLEWMDAVDPWFAHEHSPGSSRGKPCRAGSEAIAVDGAGEVQRCHFIPQRLGNLYADKLDGMLQERPCSRFKCDCFIGYAHRRDLGFYPAFGDGVLARIPLPSHPANSVPQIPIRHDPPHATGHTCPP